MERSVDAVVKPWYRQFYLRRGDAPWASDRVSDAGYEGGLEAISGFVYVGTTMYGSPTALRVRVHSEPTAPAVDDEAERVSHATLGGHGDLAILNWADDVPVAVVPLDAGVLNLRASWYGSAEAVAHPNFEIGGSELSPERVVFDLWPTV